VSDAKADIVAASKRVTRIEDGDDLSPSNVERAVDKPGATRLRR
jgi:hypothetical protein